MKHPHNIYHVVKSQLCMGCGLCTIDSAIDGVVYSSHNDCFVPKNSKLAEDSISHRICPGKGYDIKGVADGVYDKDAKYGMSLGYVHSLCATHSVSKEVLANASSGGIITQLLLFLIEKRIVDYVSVTHFVCDKDGVHTKTFLTDDKKEILKAQGSKYCPVCFDQLLEELHTHEGRVAVMATPCVIAGLRAIEKECPDYLKADITLHIANFCGGYKSFRNIKRLAEIHKVDYYNLSDFRFRGDGQPGSLRFVENTGKMASTPYPLYVGLNGYSKMLRCHLCPDATGELADIACGDAWIPRFQDDSHTWSMVICRNKWATDIMQQMEQDGLIITEKVTSDDVEQSQRLNLVSKKKRQLARMKFYSRLGYAIPDFCGQGYSQEMTSMKTEWTVYMKHKLTLWAEKAGLYMALYGNKKRKRK
jgi:coenzyme F420 hydrogenase subunit beta